MSHHFNITTLSHISIYLKDYTEAVAFYTKIFGEPPYTPKEEEITGWKLGDTYLTLFPAGSADTSPDNPRNVEFAVEVADPSEVDRLYAAFVDAGAIGKWPPEDTWMYTPMRFSCVDDPFGVRLDIICRKKD